MTPTQSYLRLVGAYCEHLDGLRWSSSEDAIEYADGETFALTPKIRLFVEGFAGGRSLIHFNHLLHLLELLNGSHRTLPHGFLRLRAAYQHAGEPPRNAGAFCAVLCKDIPGIPGGVSLREVCANLSDPNRPIRWFVSLYHDTLAPDPLPPLAPHAFEETLQRALAVYTAEEMEEWFRTGRGPVKEPAADLVRELPLPPTLTGVLAHLLEQPRLGGARAYLAQLVSALLLPVLRLTTEQIPLGGYVDVTTHGEPDRILPSQFALDETDFFRRYADRELLYFQREEPQARVERELVVLLDQGVRTWGDVRLVLSAAVVAFGKLADRHKLGFRIATTGTDGMLLDPLEVSLATLSKAVATSDLTPHPALALELVLQQPSEVHRDVVLLTHPRNLREPDVPTAARRLRSEGRLFGLSLDGAGDAELVMLKRGAKVKLRQFRVEFVRSVPAPQPVDEEVLEPAASWSGHLEPIGYPFQFGFRSAPWSVQFDDSGEWLLFLDHDGFLRLHNVESRRSEFLPRGMYKGTVLRSARQLIGVAGGFAVVGWFGEHAGVAHYDLAKRVCSVYPLLNSSPHSWRWGYVRAHHTLTACSALEERCFTISLHNQTVTEYGILPAALRPFLHAADNLLMRSEDSTFPTNGEPSLVLHKVTGQLVLEGIPTPWHPFVPLADGQPTLRGAVLTCAKCCGRTLGVLTGPFGSRWLYLFGGPDGAPLGEYPVIGDFHLSRDGRRVAFQSKTGWQCRAVHQPTDTPLQIREGGHPQDLYFTLGPAWLCLRVGKRHYHLLAWDGPKLEVCAARSDPVRTQASPSSKSWLPSCVQNDSKRFVLAAASRLIAIADCFGQVALLDRTERLVCMVFAYRKQLAMWMPDGTYYGPSALTGHPPTPNAGERIYSALRRASGWKEEQ